MKFPISDLFVVILIFCSYFKHASSIECYDCKTNLLGGTAGGECSLTRECQVGVCSIIIKSQNNGEGFITRGCGSHSNGTAIGAVTSADHGQYSDDREHVSWSTCTTDFCNREVPHEHRIHRHMEHLFNRSRINRNINDFSRGMIQCYHCSKLLDDADTTCKLSMEPVPCPTGVCVVLRIAFSGDVATVRSCSNLPSLMFLAGELPKDKHINGDSVKRFGIDLAWNTCKKNLCNGVELSPFASNAGNTWKNGFVLVINHCFLLLLIHIVT